jgi:hypothetical protein
MKIELFTTGAVVLDAILNFIEGLESSVDNNNNENEESKSLPITKAKVSYMNKKERKLKI